MPNFDSGVARYIKATGTVTNNFPVDNKGNEFLCCTYCRFYGRSYNVCKLTDEIIFISDKFIGFNCPLKKEEE